MGKELIDIQDDVNGLKIAVLRRPEFTARTKKIHKVNSWQHRRHVIHYDEHLRPLVVKVFKDYFGKHNSHSQHYLPLVRKIRFHMAAKKLVRGNSKKTYDLKYLMAKTLTAVNSIPGNLIVDDGSTNNAIEHVRSMIDKAILVIDKSKVLSLNRTNTLAELKYNDTTTPIKSEMTRITNEVCSHVSNVASNDELENILKLLRHGVTTDVPSQWSKDNGKVTSWYSKLQDPSLSAEDRFKELLSIF
ncbi:hypothetical protein [Vibrio europaeus]|uniref:hypothetical protein n=1 Tax=Vibrio europaeus TaxID=300876 RepID=UPI0018A7A905|nr:hypothetical protein [Vibrio europaeus]MDC5813052.1 hypothetical protein [Vibrio europaeus]QPG36053.1 hypothetical protein IXK98_21780 [Vibrio europaeus]